MRAVESHAEPLFVESDRGRMASGDEEGARALVSGVFVKLLLDVLETWTEATSATGVGAFVPVLPLLRLRWLS